MYDLDGKSWQQDLGMSQLSLSSGAQRGFKKEFCSLQWLLEFHWAVCKNPHWNRIYGVLFSKNYNIKTALLNIINGAVESASLANSPQDVQKLLSGVLDEGKSSFCLDDKFRRVVSDHSAIVAHTISSLTLLHSGTEDPSKLEYRENSCFLLLRQKVLKLLNHKHKQGNGGTGVETNTSTKSVNPSDSAIDKLSTAIQAQSRKRCRLQNRP